MDFRPPGDLELPDVALVQTPGNLIHGVDFESLRRTGSIFRLHVDHWGGQTGRTHAPVPFYVSSDGYGVFVDSARYLDVSVGVGVRLDARQ